MTRASQTFKYVFYGKTTFSRFEFKISDLLQVVYFPDLLEVVYLLQVVYHIQNAFILRLLTYSLEHFPESSFC